MMRGGEALLPGIKMYDLATVIETIWYWHQKKSMEKEKKFKHRFVYWWQHSIGYRWHFAKLGKKGVIQYSEPG